MEKAKPKSHKLKSTKTLARLFETGKVLKSGPLILYYLKEENDFFDFQVGFGSSKRRMRKAVDRNRTKRILREGFFSSLNSQAKELKSKKVKLALMLIYNSEKLLEFDKCQEKIKLILERLNKEID